MLCHAHDSFALHVSHFLPLGRTMPLTPTSTFSTFYDGYRSCKRCTVTSTITILSAKKRSFVKSWKNQNILDRQLKNSKLDSGEWAYIKGTSKWPFQGCENIPAIVSHCNVFIQFHTIWQKALWDSLYNIKGKKLIRGFRLELTML